MKMTYKDVSTLCTKLVVVLLVFATSQCGTQCKGDTTDHRPDITPEMLQAAGIRHKLHEILVDLKAGKSVDVNRKDTPTDTTPLQDAIDTGREDLVRLLLKEGADVNLEGGYDLSTPLIHAIGQTAYSLPIIKLLLAQPNIDKERKDKGLFDNYTALFRAIHRALPDVVQALLEAGANYTTPIDGKTPYQFALYEKTYNLGKKEERRQVVAILQAKRAPYY